jgi:presequence protease
MQDTLLKARFDELDRIRELIAQNRARREQSITGHGHSLAMTAACAGMSPAAKVAHQLSGLEGIAALKALDSALDNEQSLQEFAQTLASIHQLILQAPKQFLIVGEQEHLDSYREDLQQRWNASAANDQFAPFALPSVSEKIREAWITNTQVNFCAKAYPTVPSEHPDAAALTVLGGLLRNGYLHRAVREQGGAYGGGASQDSNTASFRFYSYRDPRLTETLDDFDQALVWLQETEHQPQAVEEAILGVIGSIDKPGSPAGEAKSTYQAELFGRTREKRELFRNRVLQVTAADLQRVARTYLVAEQASIALVTHAGQKAALETLGLQLKSC